ncbi:hypothetical protein [Streptomyces sp. SLBN-31]|uniref:hypothetical protein n=1 Tax=Streptomyces sp. SLBN-31 TaxID=2768444 RepID=UPI00114F2AE9|nr:hypothetical protein [Streptomyces sp. SLBN-31]
MHRTTTTATLLVTVAVAALTGCVTVQRPPVSGPPPTAPSQPSAPRPDGERESQNVQAPAKEALEMIGPSRRPEPRTPQHHGPAAKAPAERPAAPRSRPRAPEPKHRHHQRQPRVEIPVAGKSVPKNTKDLCALGRQYGGWHTDSPQSVICKQAYGR